MRKGLFFLAGLLFFGNTAFAESNQDVKENEFKLGVQLRPRAEYRNGALFPRAAGEEATAFINNRARISMGYQRDRLSLGFSAQHVGVWGQDPQINKNGRFDLNEAWANLDMGSGFFMKLGRQSLVYDDERILGSLDWNVAGRFHDAVKLGYEDAENKLHFILSFNQNDERIIGGTYYAPGAQPYKNMQTLWYGYQSASPFRISFLLMNLGQETGDEEKSNTKYMQTLGSNLGYTANGLQLHGTFYYQTGKNKSSRKVSAFLWSLGAAYRINPEWRISAATDYLSGAKPGSETFKAFDPLYGTHHKFYGAMDYFYASAFINGYNPGLWDNQLGITFSPSSKVNLSLTYHYFLTTTGVYDATEKLSRGLGSEIDFQIDWNIMKDVKLSAGYSTMFGTGTMKVVKGGNPSHWQDWGWVSLNINPTVFMAGW